MSDIYEQEIGANTLYNNTIFCCISEVTDPRIKEANGNYQKRVSVLNNNFTISNLTLEDYMNIQCNATNNHDYVFADVYLNVLGMFTVYVMSIC